MPFSLRENGLKSDADPALTGKSLSSQSCQSNAELQLLRRCLCEPHQKGIPYDRLNFLLAEPDRH